MTLQIKPLQSIPEQIAEMIKDNIITGQLKLGDRLPGEIELAEKFGVSRSTLREALDLLASEQIIITKQGKQGGRFITKRTTEEVTAYLMNYVAISLGLHRISLEDIDDLRVLVEVKGCGLAALHRTEQDLKDMREALLPLDKLGSPYQFHHNDIIFHKAVARATHNELMVIIMGLFTKVQEILAFKVGVTAEDHKGLVVNLNNLYQAIVDQDQQKAEDLAVEHIYYLKNKHRVVK